MLMVEGLLVLIAEALFAFIAEGLLVFIAEGLGLNLGLSFFSSSSSLCLFCSFVNIPKASPRNLNSYGIKNSSRLMSVLKYLSNI